MSALPLILALLIAQDTPGAPPPESAAAVEAPADPLADMPFPAGASHDDYGLVAWCAGALGGYLELYDKVLPEVSRIEAAFQKPGTTHAQDMKVYSDQQKEGRADMKAFARAMQAAEKASLRPIRDQGGEAMQRGHSTWAAASSMPVRSVAQQWMGWTLPARCTPTATALEARAKLLGATFKVNEESAADPAPAASPEVAAPSPAEPLPPAAAEPAPPPASEPPTSETKPSR